MDALATGSRVHVAEVETARQVVFTRGTRCIEVSGVEKLPLTFSSMSPQLRVAQKDLCVLLVVNHVGEPLSQATALFLKDPKTPPAFTDKVLQVWGFLTASTARGQSADVRYRLSTEAVLHRMWGFVPCGE